MSSVVCQGLQSISFLEPWPKVSATRPYCARSLSCARKARIFDSDSEKFQQEKNSNNEELESNNNCSDFDRDKNKKNQFCSNGSDMGGWSFIQALVNTSQDPKPAVAAEEKDEKEKLYIHPLVKRTSSQLSEKSLEMCTENLGSETGSDISEQEIIINSSNYDRVKERSKSSLPQLSKVNSREFPPPLTTISGSSRVQIKTHREGGRLVMKAVRVPCSNSYFQAERGDGRLRLHLTKDYTQSFDPEFDSLTTAAAEEVAEEVDSDEEEEEEEEEEAEAELEEEGEEDDGRERKEEEEQEEVKFRGEGKNGNSGNVGAEVEIGNYERGRRRCNEGSGRGNKLLLIQEPCWVATS